MLLFSLLVLAADPPSLMATAAARLSAACRDEACATPRGSPYRIVGEDEAEEGRDVKTRIMAEDGRRCQVIGARMCTRPPRTWLRAALLP